MKQKYQSKKNQLVENGLFYAEIHEFFSKELLEDNYSSVDVRVTPSKTELVIKSGKSQNVLGEKGKRIHGLSIMLQKRFGFLPDTIQLYAERVMNRGLSAVAQAESLRYKLLGGAVGEERKKMTVRGAGYSVLSYIMESGAKGCEITISGKLRAQRAKTMRLKDGYMISTGQPAGKLVDFATRHALLRQGVLGIKVRILSHQSVGRLGSIKTFMPDNITIYETKSKASS
jgi:small subunit ribosomal protein S3e